MTSALGRHAADISCPYYSNTKDGGRKLDDIKRDPKIKAWAQSVLDRLPRANVQTSDLYEVLGYAALRNGVPWSPKVYAQLPFDQMRDKDALALAATIPEEDRPKAFVAAIGRMSRDTGHYFAPKLLAKWPSRELAEWVIDHAEEQEESQKTILDRLRKLAKTRPAIAAALDGAPEGAHVTPVALRVTKKPKLKKPTPAANQAARRAARDYGGALESITYFAVADAKGKHVYDAYRYNGDSGKVFTAGSTKVVASIIQFEADDCDDALAAGLDAVLGYRSALGAN